MLLTVYILRVMGVDILYSSLCQSVTSPIPHQIHHPWHISVTQYQAPDHSPSSPVKTLYSLHYQFVLAVLNRYFLLIFESVAFICCVHHFHPLLLFLWHHHMGKVLSVLNINIAKFCLVYTPVEGDQYHWSFQIVQCWWNKNLVLDYWSIRQILLL